MELILIQVINFRNLFKRPSKWQQRNNKLSGFDSRQGCKYSLTINKMKTKKEVEEYLNEIGIPEDDKQSNGGRIPDRSLYGSWMRRNDPIAFHCECNDLLR